MTTSFVRRLSVGMVLAALFVAAGCDKEVKMTFFNNSDRNRELLLSGPGDGTGFLGTVPAMSKAKTRIKVDEDFLPATYRWDAGDEEGSFTVSKETPGELMIVIEQDGSIGPIDKNTEVHQDSHIEIEDMMIEQDTVIE